MTEEKLAAAPRHVAEALFPDSTIRYVNGYAAIAAQFDRFGDQRPSTCGAYAARYLLAPLGFSTADGVDTTREDYLAWLAGTVLDADEVAPAEDARRAARAAGMSDTEALARFPDTYYGWPLRSSSDPAVAGTSPAGIARAVSIGSGGRLVTLPLPARRADGAVVFDADRFERLLALLEQHLVDWQVHPIANYQSDQLLDPSSAAYRAALADPNPEAAVPRDGWAVGHFAGIGALWHAADGRRWALLLDTYKSRGWSGYEPQPVDLLRRGLVRDDGRQGGLLIVLPRAHLDAARGSLTELGLELRLWSNGSPEPEGWSWAVGR